MNQLAKLGFAAALALYGASFASANDAHHPPASVEASGMADGEIRKVDKEAGKLTIKHGPIANLDMPGMTMVFRVSDPAMLEQVKAGDKVKFAADKLNGAITVTKIDAAR
jgi:Cu(I)/Ag(I) efflux system periplasmic protein CusF